MWSMAQVSQIIGSFDHMLQNRAARARWRGP